jgi:predicted secreted hydrolase
LVNRRCFLAGTTLLLAARPVSAQDYAAVVPGHALEFPRDFGAHPAFRNEWWYITGWCKDARGAPLGVQITFFRNRPRVADTNPSRFAPRQLLFAHAAIADPRFGQLRHDQRAAREGFGLAAAAEPMTDVWIDDWSLKLDEAGYKAHVAARDFAFDLAFSRTQPVLLEGDGGFSRKGIALANASYYYSEPHLDVAGTIVTNGARTPVTGVAWLDHEWSSEGLPPGAVGWDWVGINLDEGGALMGFRMRTRSGTPFWAGGSLRSADGRVRTFDPSEIRFEARRLWRSARTGIEYPVAMAVRAGTVDYALEPIMDDQELDASATTGTIYWEGAVRTSRAGQEVGRGYLELTGYGKALTL